MLVGVGVAEGVRVGERVPVGVSVGLEIRVGLSGSVEIAVGDGLGVAVDVEAGQGVCSGFGKVLLIELTTTESSLLAALSVVTKPTTNCKTTTIKSKGATNQ